MRDILAEEAQIWRTQITTLARAEIGRSLLSKRSLPLYLLVAMPTVLMLLRAVFMPESLRANPVQATTEFAGLFQFFLLRFIIFFANALIFVRLFRGEILERSFHYTLLAPIRRPVLVVGKYVGGVISAWLLLMPTVAISYLLIHLPHRRPGLEFMTSGGGLAHLISYFLITALGCVAYGALFMLAGLFFKNPVVPAILFLGWETLTPFLPPLLKALSIVHYLVALTPVPVSLSAFALLSRPMPGWVAVVAPIITSAILVFLAVLKTRRLEISYAVD
ncbi:MAG: hypothetical protein ACC742_00945 [Thermoanaerobaculales bacterium]